MGRLWQLFKVAQLTQVTKLSSFPGGHIPKPGTLQSLFRNGHGACPCSMSQHIHSSASTAAPQAQEAHSEEAQKLYQRVWGSLDARVAPERASVLGLLESCASAPDVDLAFAALQRLREQNAARRHQMSNFSDAIAQRLVQACLRADVPHRAMVALRTRNLYGLTPSPSCLQLLLEHAARKHDLELIRDVLRAAVASGLKPSAASADAVLQIFEEVGDQQRLHRIAKELFATGVWLAPRHLDVLHTAAANAAKTQQADVVNGWRKVQGLPHTPHTAVAKAKVHILRGEAEAAVNVIAAQLKDPEQKAVVEDLLRQMAHSWADQLPKGEDGEVRKVPMQELKDRLRALGEALHAGGLSEDVQF